MPHYNDEEWKHPPRPMHGPKFEEWAEQYICSLLREDPYDAEDLTVDDIRNFFCRVNACKLTVLPLGSGR
jgi:hypothetical protein